MTTLSSKKYIIVGMSGGVDSSIAAYLLKKAGHHVAGVFMKNWQEDDTDTYCQAAEDLADAQAVCDRLKIELSMVNFADQYWERVFSLFLEEYRAMRTPNPDILCNKEIKFKAFLNFAQQKGADYIATGHYVRTKYESSQCYLLKGLDAGKDQSYFLHTLDQTQLSASVFPIGDLQKKAVRELAKTLDLVNHAKKDSTGICFIGERRFKTFLNDYLPAKPGLIKTVLGETLGEHQGLMFYTLGQRQGLQIGGKAGKGDQAWYVAEKDVRNNILIVAQGNTHSALFKSALIAKHVHWINGAPKLPARLWAKTRYRQTDVGCIIVESMQKNNGGSDYVVKFDEPQRAITPGQSVVFYQGDICLGGGIIESSY